MITLRRLPPHCCSIVVLRLVLFEVDNPYLVTFLIRALIFEWHVVWCGSKNGCQKNTCLKEIWTLCSKYDSHSRLNSQHI
jgi:hypothetical protein